MADKENMNLNEGLSNFADEDSLKEIDFTSFLEENAQGASPLYEGFHEDIEETQKSIVNELESLYEDIVSSGPATIVPKPLSVLTEKEEPIVKATAEATSLDDLWLDPEDYFDADIPVVSLDGGEEYPEQIPDEAIFDPEAAQAEVQEASEADFDSIKNDIFGMIDSLKTESMGESAFGDILNEIESNSEIVPVSEEYSDIANFIGSFSTEEYPEQMPAEEAYVQQPVAQEDFTFDPDAQEDFAFEPVAEEFAADGTDLMTLEDTSEEMPLPEVPAQQKLASDSEEFQRELAELLGDEPPQAEPVEEKTAFVIDIPDDGNDYEAAAELQNNVDEYLSNSMISAAEPVIAPPAHEPFDPNTGLEDTDDKEYKAELKAEKKAAKARSKAEKEENKNSAGEIVRKIVLAISIIVIILSGGYLGYTYLYQPTQAEKLQTDVSQQLTNSVETYGEAVVDAALRGQFGVDFPEGMLAKYAQLYAINNDLAGWINIPELSINLPVVKGSDNDYYLKKDVYKKYTNYGVPFFDYRMNVSENLHRNTVIYGHNMRSDDLIFGTLENYKTVEGFKSAPVIECNTIYGNYTWFVYAVFITNAYGEDDNGYVLPYNFIDLNDAKFESYIAEIDKRKLYDTGVGINATDKILTLSTCSYEFSDARLVVVARLKRDNESVTVDTSKVTKNPNPKYPQAWYDAYKKTNPYADDARW